MCRRRTRHRYLPRFCLRHDAGLRTAKVPGQQFINPADLVIVYAVENVGEVGLGINAVQLGRFNQGHGACQGFRSGVSTRKEPVLATDSNWA